MSTGGVPYTEVAMMGTSDDVHAQCECGTVDAASETKAASLLSINQGLLVFDPGQNKKMLPS